ncbi:hypothetical protein PIB30_072554 [Stylosanthes scabra]|uniref:Uncharacterized protein n=1 Tax=Stylosanthes scabra TaxID=79078 RepID=A0ABU6XPZ3_9FABA|nr:hypothetical protein [Stylosanthes scabra]
MPSKLSISKTISTVATLCLSSVFLCKNAGSISLFYNSWPLAFKLDKTNNSLSSPKTASSKFGKESELNNQWPDLLRGPENDWIWDHEWNTHGGCSENEFNQTVNFELSLKIKQRLDIIGVLSGAGLGPKDNRTESRWSLEDTTVVWDSRSDGAANRDADRTIMLEVPQARAEAVLVRYMRCPFFATPEASDEDSDEDFVGDMDDSSKSSDSPEFVQESQTRRGYFLPAAAPIPDLSSSIAISTLTLGCYGGGAEGWIWRGWRRL